MRSVLGWAGQVFAWLVILAMVSLLAVAVVIPRLGGATPYTVLTGSMQPGMPPGTLVVVRPIDPADVAVGTVITYQLESGRPTVVTHRVTGIGVDARGELRYTTQGDANSAPDAQTVRPVQVRGARWYAVPHLGRVNLLMSGQERQVAVYVAAALLLGYAGYQFVSASTRPRRRRQQALAESAA
ncbi:S26 family signal peptidase [Nocardioides sp. Soil777]|uniref:signal peptidase I n=1 Tax=Nocardioides sp. Soil777 TaxID=1736409 RepID=UPI000702B6B1|nr:signal peptidase I [Nocardioides sp. Soil777]KRE98069.1 S26 family signal peptidase [Nocardioides sp. Soil777]